MIARLSDELAQELERSGDEPLTVEDPRTHKLYVLVAAERFHENRQVAKSKVVDDESIWSDAKNARRFALIEKDIAGQLTAEESCELKVLQAECDAYLRLVAPLPLQELQSLHSRLLREARLSSDSSS